MKYEGGFKCDAKAKQKLKDLIENVWFSSCTIKYDIANENDPMALVDTIFTAITKDNKFKKYAIELKYRKGYKHTDFKGDWVIEPKKLIALENYQILSGYTSVYFNIFNDGYWALWTLDTITETKQPSTIKATKTTQGNDKEKIEKPSFMVNFNNANLTGITNDNL